MYSYTQGNRNCIHKIFFSVLLFLLHIRVVALIQEEFVYVKGKVFFLFASSLESRFDWMYLELPRSRYVCPTSLNWNVTKSIHTFPLTSENISSYSLTERRDFSFSRWQQQLFWCVSCYMLLNVVIPPPPNIHTHVCVYIYSWQQSAKRNPIWDVSNRKEKNIVSFLLQKKRETDDWIFSGAAATAGGDVMFGLHPFERQYTTTRSAWWQPIHE